MTEAAKNLKRHHLLQTSDLGCSVSGSAYKPTYEMPYPVLKYMSEAGGMNCIQGMPLTLC